MKTSSQSPQAQSKKALERDAQKSLSENEKKSLELKEHAEHETGMKREKLQKEAAAKVE